MESNIVVFLAVKIFKHFTFISFALNKIVNYHLSLIVAISHLKCVCINILCQNAKCNKKIKITKIFAETRNK